MTPVDDKSDSTTALFREEVYESQAERLQGTILLARPNSMWSYVALSMLAAILVGAFALFGTYTRRETVQGEVASSQNVAKVYGPVEGTIVRRLVSEGQRVRVGQPLFIISTEINRGSGSGAQSAIAVQLNSRISALSLEKERRQVILTDTLHALAAKVRNLQESLSAIQVQTEIQRSRVAVNQGNLDRLRTLTVEGFYTKTQFEDRQADVLEQRAKLAEDERSAVDARTELRTAQTDLLNAPLEQRNEISQLERQISELKEQDISNDTRREISVASLVAGTATTPLTDSGDVVSPSTLLITILPDGAHMDAHLYVPSRAIGFVKVGTPVAVRYDAFPFQKFGQYRGHVSEVSRVALSPAELREISADREPLYRVTMALDEQTVLANGAQVPVEDGMKLEADLLLETRRIYEWMLEPLYTISKRYDTNG
jgi:membrane fusion protein